MVCLVGLCAGRCRTDLPMVAYWHYWSKDMVLAAGGRPLRRIAARPARLRDIVLHAFFSHGEKERSIHRAND